MEQILQLCHDRKLTYELHPEAVHIKVPWSYEEIPNRSYPTGPVELIRRWKYFRYLRQLWALERAEVNWDQSWPEILGVHYDPIVERLVLPPPLDLTQGEAALAYLQSRLPGYDFALTGSILDGTSLEGLSDIDIKVLTTDVIQTYQKLAEVLPVRRQRHSLRLEDTPYGPIDLVPYNPETDMLCSFRPQAPTPQAHVQSRHYEFTSEGMVQVAGGHQFTYRPRYEAVGCLGVPEVYRKLSPRTVLQLLVYSALHDVFVDPHFLPPPLQAALESLEVQQRGKDANAEALAQAKLIFPERSITLASTLGNYGQSIVIDLWIHLHPGEDLGQLRQELQTRQVPVRIFPCCFIFPQHQQHLRYFVYDPTRHEIARARLTP